MTLKKAVFTVPVLILALSLAGCGVSRTDTSKLNSRTTATEAVQALQVRAAAGDSEAQNELGDAYRDGLGVPQDWGLDYFWNSLAANAAGPEGDSAAIARNVAALHLSATQIAALDQRVKDFRPTQPSAAAQQPQPAQPSQPPTAPLQRH
jgi:TPR repeat protein